MILRSALLLLAIVSTAWTLRCQCSTDSGAVKCYNQWCEVQAYDGKVGACAVVQKGSKRLFACVRVKQSSEDQCMVDRINGELQVRCWCRGADYCNIDLADRVEESQMIMTAKGATLEAEEVPTSTVLSVQREKQDDFVIEQTYDQSTEEDNDDFSDDDFLGSEESLPLNIRPAPARPTPPTLPPVYRSPVSNVVDESIPPWRREYALPSRRQPPPPPSYYQPPVLPPSRPPTTVTTTTTTTTRPTTTTSTTTTTTTRPPTTTTTTTRRPTTTSTTTTTTTTPVPVVQRSQYERRTPEVSPTREQAARTYQSLRDRYRPLDLTAKITTTEKTHENSVESKPATALGAIVFPPGHEKEAKKVTTTTTTTRRPTTTRSTTTTTTTEAPTTTTTHPPTSTTVPTTVSTSSPSPSTSIVFPLPSDQRLELSGPRRIDEAKRQLYNELARPANICGIIVSFIVLLLVH